MPPSKSTAEFEIKFEISDRSRNLLQDIPWEFTGAEVEGSLAVQYGSRWLGERREEEASEPLVWFEPDAAIWNFVWDIANAALAMKHGSTEQVVEVEGTPVRLVVSKSGNGSFRLDEKIVPPPTANGEAFAQRFTRTFSQTMIPREVLYAGIKDAIERLVEELKRINPKIPRSAWVHRLHRTGESLGRTS